MSNQSHPGRKDPPLYDACYVALLDILGFKDLVLRNRESPFAAGGPLASIQSQLLRGRLHESLPDAYPLRWRGYWFSDTVVLVCEESNPALLALLGEMQVLVGRMLFDHQILVRGAVVHGSIYSKGELLFGPALVEAYELAESIAVYPRVILQEDIARLRPVVWEKNHPVAHRSFAVSVDGDGVPYLDVLRARSRFVALEDGSIDPEAQRSRFLERVASIAQNGLEEYSTRPRVAAKYLWLETKLAELVDTTDSPASRRGRAGKETI